MATKYTLTKDEFTAITETSGTIQNVGTEVVELVSTTNETEGEGILLAPHEKRTFNGSLAARGTGDLDAAVNVVDFTEAGEGGEEYVLPVATASRLGGVKSSTEDGKVSVNDDGTMTMNGGGISVWEPDKAYKVDAVVIESNLIWQCVTAHTSTSTFDKSKWVCLSGAGVAVWQPDTDYEVQDVVIYNYALYICREAHTSATDFEYDKWIPMSGTGSSSDPIGTVIHYMGNTPPSDYLACDGTIYNITDYQDLADHINTQFGRYNYFGGDGTSTFAVPDLRGEFLRGAGTNSHENQGSGASVGVHQDGTSNPIQSIDTGDSNSIRFLVNSDTSDTRTLYMDRTYNSVSSGTISYKGAAIDKNSATGSQYNLYTSRPTNTSVLYCIKYKNSGITYSTGEQKIGTWIDGKPLYQKTIVDTMPTVTITGTMVTKNIDIASLNIKMCVSIEGFIYKENSFESLPINSTNNISEGIGRFCEIARINSSNSCADSIFIASSLLSDSNQPCYITLQYTKTTD